MTDIQVDRAAGFFLNNKRFIDFINDRDFENYLRQIGLLDLWRVNKKSSEIRSMAFGMDFDEQDYFTEFLREVNERGGRKAVAQVCLSIALGFATFDTKRAKETLHQISNIIIPSLGYTFGRTGNLIKIDEPEKEEILVEDEFESLLLEFGKEYLETRRKAWDFIRSKNPKFMKNAIDEHRRLFDNILRTLAPDDLVIKSKFYDNKKHKEENSDVPFRPERIKFTLYDVNYGEKEMKAIQSICNTVSSLYDLYNSEVHLLSDSVKETRLIVLIGEKIIYLLINKHRKT